MMRLKAQVQAYSSVVGGGVLLIGPKGNMVGQIAFLCHDDELRGKDVQAKLSEVIAEAINSMGAA